MFWLLNIIFILNNVALTILFLMISRFSKISLSYIRNVIFHLILYYASISRFIEISQDLLLFQTTHTTYKIKMK